jgi:hypothetical protein
MTPVFNSLLPVFLLIATGCGLQSDLTAIPDSMANILLDARVRERIEQFASRGGDHEVGRERFERAIERAILNDMNVTETETLAVVFARREQGKFRYNVDNSKWHVGFMA